MNGFAASCRRSRLGPTCERILPVIDEALRRAQVSLDDLSAIAVANTPGLSGSLLVGLVAAKTLCVAARQTAGRRQSPARARLRLPDRQRTRMCFPASG